MRMNALLCDFRVATLPRIRATVVEDNEVPSGALIASLGFGPGLTIAGALFRKRW
jgi:hypothetical protein